MAPASATLRRRLQRHLTNPQGVTATARANYGALRACYEHELRANQQLRGPLTARLKINTSGHADEVQVSTPMRSAALVQCVKRALQRVTYPPARGGCAIAEVSFNFTPRD
ncbi:MAG: AgmX/PglI C-terminal domain-containing protein [Polyangiales bacterium]